LAWLILDPSLRDKGARQKFANRKS
jgi:hypothetical protein